MRSREMHNRLDKLSSPADDDEQRCHDTSLLSPEDQDWLHDMFAKIEEGSITEAEGRKVWDLLNELPILGPNDNFAGPNLNIPREIETHFLLLKWYEEGRRHWPRFDFHKLRATQKVRFVELCRQYGWEGEYPRCWSRVYFSLGRWGIPQLLQLSEWDTEDEAELRSFLDDAA